LGFILRNSVNDSVSFAFFHNQVAEYDKEYGKEMSRIEKKLKNDLEAQYDLHHIFYIIGFILMTFGEFKVKNSSKDTFNTSLLNVKY
jgi:hypothetical protein